MNRSHLAYVLPLVMIVFIGLLLLQRARDRQHQTRILRLLSEPGTEMTGVEIASHLRFTFRTTVWRVLDQLRQANQVETHSQRIADLPPNENISRWQHTANLIYWLPTPGDTTQ